MNRRLPLLALLLVPALAPAQGLKGPYRPPHAAVVPLPGPIPVAGIGGGLAGFSSPWAYYPGSLSGFGYGYPGGFQPDGYPYVGPLPYSAPAAPPPPPLEGVAPSRRADAIDAAVASARVVAELTVELPAAADVWVDGVKQPGAATAVRTLTSPPLGLGGSHTFKVRGRWADGGKEYEVERASTVAAGERGKLAVFRGTPVK